MKIHNWTTEIINATHGAPGEALKEMRLIIYNHKTKPLIQQFTNNYEYVGLQVFLPKFYNKADMQALINYGKNVFGEIL